MVAIDDETELPLDGDCDILAAMAAAESADFAPDDAVLARLPHNDDGNARRLIARFGRELIHVEERGWLAWDGRCWSDQYGKAIAEQRSHETARLIYREASVAANRPLRIWAKKSGMAPRVAGMLSMAQPYLKRKSDEFDADPYALTVVNGTLHLRCGGDGDFVALKTHASGDMITRCADASYDPGAACPKWLAFIESIQPGEPEMQLFLQTWLGYSLTGSIAEQRVCIFDGQGSNGKSTLIDVVASVMGGYACTAPIETWLHNDRRTGSGPSPDLARLPGARLVRTSEPDPGARLSESVIKQWTGGERIATRKLGRDFFEFRPVGKLTMSVNAKPVVVGKDFGIRRRLLIVPFRQRFARLPGYDLTADLLTERSGILNWLLDGWRIYAERGLVIPKAVEDATEAYFTEMDPIGQFVREACDTADPAATEQSALLYAGYKRWCEASNEEPRKQTPFGRRLSDLGFIAGRCTHGGRKSRMGIKLKMDWWPSSHEEAA
jgi:putative DNA primase/helicase